MQTSSIAWFKDIGLADRPRVGGKGGSLGELTRAGIEVPPGFVVCTQAFEQFIAALERQAPLRARVESLPSDDLDAISSVSREIRVRVEEAEMPADLSSAILSAYQELGSDGQSPIVAVRSSATTEDASDASFAGLQDTFLWVMQPDEVLRKIRTCWASLYSVESISYRLRQRFPESAVAMAVVVQTMVDARTAGVMFTRSPTTGDKSVITIEGAWGLGSAVVSGEVTPDRWVVGKITGEIPVREISDKAILHAPAAGGGVVELPVEESQRRQACLTDEELLLLRAVARRVERHYGKAQDIEWAVERRSNRILLLQSRPETVWSNRESTPAAKAAVDPRIHVMSIFGGRK